MTLSQIIKLLGALDGVVEMVIEGECPSRLRVELTTEDVAKEFAFLVEFIAECRTAIRGSVVIVEEQD